MDNLLQWVSILHLNATESEGFHVMLPDHRKTTHLKSLPHSPQQYTIDLVVALFLQLVAFSVKCQPQSQSHLKQICPKHNNTIYWPLRSGHPMDTKGRRPPTDKQSVSINRTALNLPSQFAQSPSPLDFAFSTVSMFGYLWKRTQYFARSCLVELFLSRQSNCSCWCCYFVRQTVCD